MPSDEVAQNRFLKRTIWLYCGFQFFFSLLFWLPVFYEYQKRIGLSDEQIFRIQSIYYVAFCVLEIPTGMMADQIGHRRCMRIGAAVLVVANILPIAIQNYAGFLLHFLLMALSRSYISGASSAYLYDFLDQHNARDHYKQIEGNARAYGLFGKVACWSLVGFLMQWHLTLPYWLTVGAALVSVLFALTLPAVTTRSTANLALGGLARRLSSVGQTLLMSPFLAIAIFQGIAAFVLARICQVNLFQPILEGKKFCVESYGMVMSVMTLFEAFGSARPGWVRRWLDDFQAVFVLTVLLAVSLWLIPLGNQIGAIVLLTVFSYITGLVYPIQRQLINDCIPDSRHRATIMSIESIVDRATNAWLADMIGDFLKRGALNDYLALSSWLTIASMAGLFVLSRSRTFRRPV